MTTGKEVESKCFEFLDCVKICKLIFVCLVSLSVNHCTSCLIDSTSFPSLTNMFVGRT